MKKFITAIPQQNPETLRGAFRYHYEPVGNPKLAMEEKVAFPILTAVHGYLQKGEDYQIIAVVADSENGRKNLDFFKEELKMICESIGAEYREPHPIFVKPEQSVSYLASVFVQITRLLGDNDELFACITFETKPLSMTIRMAVQYAYRVKKNVSMECLLYGFIDRSAGKDSSCWTGKVYDETALIQMDELINLLIEQGVEDPGDAINRILGE